MNECTKTNRLTNTENKLMGTSGEAGGGGTEEDPSSPAAPSPCRMRVHTGSLGSLACPASRLKLSTLMIKGASDTVEKKS